jgi:hypothetical protein
VVYGKQEKESNVELLRLLQENSNYPVEDQRNLC